jgi:peptide/nickel transport system permease protein
VSLVLLVVFSYHIGIFPLAGMATPASGLTGLAYWRDVAWHMFLPALAVVIMYIGQYVLITRNAMQEVLDQDYILAARAKGIKESAILRRHALRNAILPVVTMTGINLAWAVAGSLQVEIVFSWPGIGRLMYEAILKRDYPILQGLFLVFAVAVVLANLAVDLIYGRLDPRIKVGGKQ